MMVGHSLTGRVDHASFLAFPGLDRLGSCPGLRTTETWQAVVSDAAHCVEDCFQMPD